MRGSGLSYCFGPCEVRGSGLSCCFGPCEVRGSGLSYCFGPREGSVSCCFGPHEVKGSDLHCCILGSKKWGGLLVVLEKCGDIVGVSLSDFVTRFKSVNMQIDITLLGLYNTQLIQCG